MIVTKKKKQNTTIGISEYKLSTDVNDTLITYSLGSCLGVTLYDPVSMVGGLIHCQLPLSSLDEQKAQLMPAMFVSSGIPKIFENMYDRGAVKNRIILKAAGCSNIMDPNGRFNIGERNLILLKKLTWKNKILIAAQDVGGNVARTMSLVINTGKTYIKKNGITSEL